MYRNSWACWGSLSTPELMHSVRMLGFNFKPKSLSYKIFYHLLRKCKPFKVQTLPLAVYALLASWRKFMFRTREECLIVGRLCITMWAWVCVFMWPVTDAVTNWIGIGRYGGCPNQKTKEKWIHRQVKRATCVSSRSIESPWLWPFVSFIALLELLHIFRRFHFGSFRFSASKNCPRNVQPRIGQLSNSGKHHADLGGHHLSAPFT